MVTPITQYVKNLTTNSSRLQHILSIYHPFLTAGSQNTQRRPCETYKHNEIITSSEDKPQEIKPS